MINIGLIGFGYWGPNLARNFHHNPFLELTAISDFSDERLKTASRLYPGIKLLKDAQDIISDHSIDIAAIATPVSTHFDLAKRALLAGKHVWLEKPMTETVEQGEELIELAAKKNRKLQVDHTFVYTGAVRKIHSLIDSGEMGDLIYYDSTRVNLGLFQQDVDVIWDLAPHDIAILDYLMPFEKLAVSATGSDYFGTNMTSKSLLTIFMANKVVAHINVSWVSPVKIRQTLIGGTSKMILYDDLQPSEKLKIYDKGVELDYTREDLYRIQVQYRIGDMYAPKLEDHEALALETQHFAECIAQGHKPLTDGHAGLEVVKVLIAAQKSLRLNGTPVDIK
ncbi:MAG: Gfo/Idh/MocA family oxidoreductase [Desulfosarcina sp.]|nr:Gfo/Idh/MocA family oxidoreductase [Desulfobacterales bacterium]